MNQDIYAEWLVKRKTPGYVYIAVPAVVLACLIGLFLAFFTQWGVIATVLIFVGCYFLVRTFKVEYEYVFVTNELDIDRILNQSRRKRAYRLQMENVELVAPWESHELDNFRNNPGFKLVDVSSGYAKHKRYGIVYSESGNNTLFIFEPNDRILDVMHRCSPRKVVQ